MIPNVDAKCNTTLAKRVQNILRDTFEKDFVQQYNIHLSS